MPKGLPETPATRRVKNATFTKDEIAKMPPALARIAKVNKAADKYKWGSKGPK